MQALRGKCLRFGRSSCGVEEGLYNPRTGIVHGLYKEYSSLRPFYAARTLLSLKTGKKQNDNTGRQGMVPQFGRPHPATSYGPTPEIQDVGEGVIC